jgi:hypothetical protein
MANASLSFTLRLATSDADLREVCAVRAKAYAHHLPELGRQVAEPEPVDYAMGTAILLCRDKVSGRGVGTARIRSSAQGALGLESSVTLPDWLRAQSRAEITRMSAIAGADASVKLCLMKACYLYSLANQIRWLAIGARSPALIRDYQRLGFVDPFDAECWIALAHAGGLPHRILVFDVTGAERAWHAIRHPLYAFMAETFHPDLQLFAPRAGSVESLDALRA